MLLWPLHKGCINNMPAPPCPAFPSSLSKSATVPHPLHTCQTQHLFHNASHRRPPAHLLQLRNPAQARATRRARANRSYSVHLLPAGHVHRARVPRVERRGHSQLGRLPPRARWLVRVRARARDEVRASVRGASSTVRSSCRANSVVFGACCSGRGCRASGA
ncbi:hypothetical protein BDW22DRAFT_318102 [Trametopsis cervina]|nr:hypothetical protein BDW22DRAFT_318102 [Trametopsis cervina]